jgi:hypothetical protein
MIGERGAIWDGVPSFHPNTYLETSQI